MICVLPQCIKEKIWDIELIIIIIIIIILILIILIIVVIIIIMLILLNYRIKRATCM